MLHRELMQDCIGKEIQTMNVDPECERLYITFTDGTNLGLGDDPFGCETRYMVIEEDLADYIGARFMGMEEKPSKKMLDPEENVHEVTFVDVLTTKGTLTIVNHNEHNGYYGGFNGYFFNF